MLEDADALDSTAALLAQRVLLPDFDLRLPHAASLGAVRCASKMRCLTQGIHDELAVATAGRRVDLIAGKAARVRAGEDRDIRRQAQSCGHHSTVPYVVRLASEKHHDLQLR